MNREINELWNKEQSANCPLSRRAVPVLLSACAHMCKMTCALKS